MSTPGPARSARDPRIDGIRLVLAALAVMYATEVVDSIDNHRLDQWGIRPRDAQGLLGVVTAPFLHVSFGHLLSNTIPFATLGIAIALSGIARVVSVTLIVGLVGGLGTWLVAPSNSVHLGASGLVFGYGAYLISRGLFERSVLYLAVGAVVAVLYGGALLGLVPHDGISWEGHLFGGIGGVLAARVLAADTEATKPKRPQTLAA